jgi:hypothetical protein
MPGGDRTGPLGYGPMTGRGAGYCAGYAVPGYANPIPGRGSFGYGRGFGRGRGWFGRGGGRGWRHWYYATGLPGWARPGFGWPAYGTGPYQYPNVPEPTPQEETKMLKEQAELLKNELKDIQDRISTLEKTQVQEKK